MGGPALANKACELCGKAFHPERAETRFCSMTCYRNRNPASDAKSCTACGKVKPLSAFYKAKHQKFGVRSVCIACFAIKAKVSRIEAKAIDPEGFKARDAVKGKRARAKRRERGWNRPSRRHVWKIPTDQPLIESQLAAKATWLKRKGVVYTITLIADGRAYVGSTSVGFARRMSSHLHMLRKGTHHSIYMQRCFTKYGESAFAFEIIESEIPIADLIQAETYAIVRLRPVFNGDHPRATRLGYTHRPESLEKMSSAQKGISRHTPASRAAIGAASRGNTYAVGNKNRLKVTPAIKARIDELVASGLGSYRIAHIVGLSKKTIINVRKERHSYV